MCGGLEEVLNAVPNRAEGPTRVTEAVERQAMKMPLARNRRLSAPVRKGSFNHNNEKLFADSPLWKR